MGILLIAINRGRNGYDFNTRFENQEEIHNNLGSLQKQTYYSYQKQKILNEFSNGEGVRFLI
jgi:hypothetical protein